MDVKDVVLTDEMKAKFKDFLGFDVEATFPYVPKVFRGKDVPVELKPVFVLRSKNGLDVAKAEDSSGYFEYDAANKGKSKLVMQSGSARVEALRKGIVKIKNFIMENGKAISFDSSDKDANIDEVIKRIRPQLQVELQEAINERAVMAPEELLGLEY
jgi:hypothetical protein